MDVKPEEIEEKSIWPLLLALGITLMLAGIVSSLVVTGVGIILLLFSLGGWAQENRMMAQTHPEEDEE